MPAQQGGGRGAAQTICVERKRMLSSPLHHPSGGSPPPLRGGGCAASVLATYRARVLPTTTRRNRLAPGNQRGSGAPRGASNQCRATPTHVAMSRRLGRGARRRQVYAICATHLLPGRARLPALCCGSRQGFDPLTQLQAMLPGTRVEAGVTALSYPSPGTAPPAAVLVPQGVMPKAARDQLARANLALK